MAQKKTVGFWFLVIPGIFILAMLIFGQMMAFINYDFAVSLGLQESREIISEMGVAANKGFGVGDTIIYLPLLVMGLIGVWTRKRWGDLVMTGALGITAYWPMVCLFLLIFAQGSPGFSFTSYTSYSILLSLITIYGVWGIWYIYSKQKPVTN